MSEVNSPSGLDPAGVYRGFLEALNRQDLHAAEQFVDVVAYRENCVAFTPGYVNWEDARPSIERIWKAIPNLRVDIETVITNDSIATAHGVARGTAMGRLYGGSPALSMTRG